MLRPRALSTSVSLALALSAASAFLAASAPPAADPLAAEIERWTKVIAESPGTDEMSKDMKASSGPVVAKAADALRDGRRLLALHRLASIRPYLVGATFVLGRSESERKELPAFEATWTRLASTLKTRPAGRFDDVYPAAVRALAELTDHQIAITYEASLDYGKSTEPLYGLFYLGTAEGQRDTVTFLRTLSRPSDAPSPAFRALDGELDALEREVLALYRPPISIDRHSDFIGLGSAMKEARELSAAGLYRGALLRYLQAAQRLGTLKPAASAPERDTLASALKRARERLAADAKDHSLGLIFVETAEADLAAAAAGARAAVAEAVVSDVLPRYLPALAPAKAQPARPAAVATITLVRWPYT